MSSTDKNSDKKFWFSAVILFAIGLLIAFIYFIVTWKDSLNFNSDLISSNCSVIYHNITETRCGVFDDTCYDASVGLSAISTYIGYISLGRFHTNQLANIHLNKDYPIGSYHECYYIKGNYRSIVLELDDTLKPLIFWILGLILGIILIISSCVFIFCKRRKRQQYVNV